MADIQVTPTQLRSKAQELKVLNQKFKASIETLEQRERSLVSQWKGESRDEFDRVFQQNRNQFNEFYQGIEKYIRVLEDAANAYENAERKNRQTAQTC